MVMPDIEATWFVDPPYNNRAGSYYIENSIDYVALGTWCHERRGQAIVCENEGADWLPFRSFKDVEGWCQRSGLQGSNLDEYGCVLRLTH
jgi:hypothetical protein